MEYSNFRSFAKLKTHSIPYSAFAYHVKFELTPNTKHMTKLTKNPVFEKQGFMTQKLLFLTQKQGFITKKAGIPNIPEYTECSEYVLFRMYKIIRNYRVITELLFS